MVSTTTHVVAVEPNGIEIEVREGETIMAAAERSGYRWPTLCRGDGTCSICWVEVKTGADRLSTMDDRERDTLELVSAHIRANHAIRLACQARVSGDLTVRRTGVRPA